MSLTRMKGRLQGYTGQGETYECQDLRSGNAFGAVFSGCKFDRCKMALFSLQQASLSDVVFENCTMSVVNMTLLRNMRNVVFDRCDLEQADFTGSYMDGVSFRDSRLWGAKFFGVTAKEVRFDGSNLHGADLRYHIAPNVAYADSNLWGAHVALGCTFFDSTFDERSCKQFIAFMARIYPNEDVRARLTQIAGDQFPVVDRLMREAL